MTPSSEQRDAIFKTFGRAFFKQDLDLMYEAVTPDFTWTVDDGDQVVGAHLEDAVHAAHREGDLARGRAGVAGIEDEVQQ